MRFFCQKNNKRGNFLTDKKKREGNLTVLKQCHEIECQNTGENDFSYLLLLLMREIKTLYFFMGGISSFLNLLDYNNVKAKAKAPIATIPKEASR